MTGPTGTAPPLEGNTFLIKNEINRVLHPYPLCELLLYLFLLRFPFPCGKEKALYEGLPCLGNFCFSFRQHEHKNGIPSDRRASTFIEEAKRFAGGGTFEAILKLRIQRPIN